MNIHSRWLVFALSLGWLAGDQMAVATENKIGQTHRVELTAAAGDDRIIVQPEGSTYSAGLFRGESCKADSGLILRFQDGAATVNEVGLDHMGGSISRDGMTFHLGIRRARSRFKSDDALWVSRKPRRSAPAEP